jgi:hypothetical protein
VKRPSVVVLLCAFAAVTAAAQAQSSPQAATISTVAVKGQMLIGANGARLGPVYRVGADGSAQIFIDGKLVSIPASTLSTASGKLTTSLSKSEVIALR